MFSIVCSSLNYERGSFPWHLLCRISLGFCTKSTYCGHRKIKKINPTYKNLLHFFPLTKSIFWHFHSKYNTFCGVEFCIGLLIFVNVVFEKATSAGYCFPRNISLGLFGGLMQGKTQPQGVSLLAFTCECFMFNLSLSLSQTHTRSIHTHDKNKHTINKHKINTHTHTRTHTHTHTQHLHLPSQQPYFKSVVHKIYL